MDFESIHDLLAVRVIVKDIECCYRALGVIHNHFKPISEDIDDYIAKPKPNGYRALHTTIYSDADKITEIQIKTGEMQKEAEYGICAHWSYKENIDLKIRSKNYEWVQDVSEFWKNFKIDFLPDRVFAFTPKGDIISLPKDSTPVDFAYAVHSDIGNHCEFAKINGKIVQLNRPLENGDIVEISVNKNKKPSKDWLRFIKTSLAKSHIKKLTEETSGFKLPIPTFIRRKIVEISEARKKKVEEKLKLKREKPRQVVVAGQKGMLIH